MALADPQVSPVPEAVVAAAAAAAAPVVLAGLVAVRAVERAEAGALAGEAHLQPSCRVRRLFVAQGPT
jgi:hypothetical protein